MSVYTFYSYSERLVSTTSFDLPDSDSVSECVCISSDNGLGESLSRISDIIIALVPQLLQFKLVCLSPDRTTNGGSRKNVRYAVRATS